MLVSNFCAEGSGFNHSYGRRILWCLISTLLSPVAIAEPGKIELVEINTTGKAVISGDTTYTQAKTRALNRARATAVEQAAGVNVISETIIQNSLMLSELTKTFSYGFLVKESVTRWHGYWAKDMPNSLGYPVIEVNLRGSVKVLPNSFFNKNAFTASLNKKVFVSGELAQIKIKPKVDLYIIIANYTATNTITPILPSDYFGSNFLKAGTLFTLPSQNSANLNLQLENYKGHQQDDEAFIVFGFPKTPETDRILWHNLFEQHIDIPYAQFFNTVLNLQTPWVSEKTLIYSIHAK